MQWIHEYGLPPADCQHYEVSDTPPCALDLNVSSLATRPEKSSLCEPKQSIYASGYGYVGGCYECCSEAAMMEEIYNSGPIVAALDVRHSSYSLDMVWFVRPRLNYSNTQMGYLMMSILIIHVYAMILIITSMDGNSL